MAIVTAVEGWISDWVAANEPERCGPGRLSHAPDHRLLEKMIIEALTSLFTLTLLEGRCCKA